MKQLRRWYVTIPITGFAVIAVEAETEEEARVSAYEKVDIDYLEKWEPDTSKPAKVEEE